MARTTTYMGFINLYLIPGAKSAYIHMLIKYPQRALDLTPENHKLTGVSH